MKPALYSLNVGDELRPFRAPKPAEKKGYKDIPILGGDFLADSVAEFIGRTTMKERRRMKRWLKATRKKV